MQKCKAEPVQEGAKTIEELLNVLSIAYVKTLKNIDACNIKTEAAINYVEKVKTERNIK